MKYSENILLGYLKMSARALKLSGACYVKDANYPTYAKIIDLIYKLDGTKFYIER